MSISFSALPASTDRIVRWLRIGLGLGAAACGGGGRSPATPTDAPPASAPAGARADGPLTPARCEAAGGKVVGDIGDGAVYRSDYRCASGKAPLGSIVPESGQPVAIEGAVCCSVSPSF